MKLWRSKGGKLSAVVTLAAVAVYFLLESLLSYKAQVFAGLAVLFVFAVFSALIRKSDKKHYEVFKEIRWGGFFLAFLMLAGDYYNFIGEGPEPYRGVGLAVGLFVAILYIVLLIKSNIKWVVVLAGIIIGVFAMFISIHLLDHMNYVFDFSEPVECSAVIEEKIRRHRRRGSNKYEFEVTFEGEDLDFDIAFGIYRKYEEGDVLVFKKYKGAFNRPFYIVEE